MSNDFISQRVDNNTGKIDLLRRQMWIKRQSYSCNRPWSSTGFEMSTLQHFLDNCLTDGDEVCQPYAPAALYPQENSWYPFLLVAESNRGSWCGWKD
jgi:hypothetical protein